PKKNLLVEPMAKNTAAAIGLACITIRRVDPGAVTLVLSSDQIIKQKSGFLKAIRKACIKAEEGDCLVAIGIRPSRAAVEYGYLKIAQSKKIYKVERFVEKPDIKKAKAYLKSKNYLWNAGIFVWKVNSIHKAIKRHLPKLYSGLQRIEKAQGKPKYKNQLAKEYSRFENISIDYGIMEKARNIYAVVGDFLLADIGSWANLSSGSYPKDADGNIIQGLSKGIDTYDSIIFSQEQHLIATLGLRDLIVVHTPDATLVCKKDKAQDIKKLTQILEKDKPVCVGFGVSNPQQARKIPRRP
ncbi:unnamed protein product, partial [marine sediment metagenome]